MEKNVNVLLLLIIFLIGNASAGLYYEVSVSVDNDKVNIDSLEVFYSRQEMVNPEMDATEMYYAFELVDDEGRVVLSEDVGVINFNYNETWEDEDALSEILVLTDYDFIVYLPYLENVNEIVMRNSEGEVVGEQSSKTFAKVRSEVSDVADAGEKVTVEDGESARMFLYFVLVIVVILIIVLIIVFYKRKK